MHPKIPQEKITVGVVFGGESGEHEVSINSARTVLKALNSGLNQNRFNVISIYIDFLGRWWPSSIAQKALEKGIALNEKDLNFPSQTRGFQALPLGSEKVDIWYPVLHGPNGEDGTVQGLFKLMKKPFVGSGVLASAVGMDKLAMKAAFSSAGLPQLPYFSLNAFELSKNNFTEELLHKLKIQFGYPCFIKPANLGSSVGITKASNQEEFLKGLSEASNHDQRIVVEKGVTARELECAVLGGQLLKVSAVGEIKYEADWYDYETKYSQNSSKTFLPASLPKGVSEQIQNLTLQACKAIDAKGMARVDFFYEEEKDQIWINEINTLPGFTSQSMYPTLWQASGVTIEQLVAKLVEIAKE